MPQPPHRRNLSLLPYDPPAVRTLHRSLRKINSGHSQSHYLLTAKQHYQQGHNLHTAITNFQHYLALNPNHQQSLYLCAVCYMHLQQYQKAIGRLRQCLEVRKSGGGKKLVLSVGNQNPDVVQVCLLLSMAYSKMGLHVKALQTVNEALRQNNKYDQGYCFRAKIYMKNGEHQKAFYDYKQALKCNDHCWAAMIGLGDYYTQVDQYRQALKQYERARDQLANEKQQKTGDKIRIEDQEKSESLKASYARGREGKNYRLYTEGRNDSAASDKVKEIEKDNVKNRIDLRGLTRSTKAPERSKLNFNKQSYRMAHKISGFLENFPNNGNYRQKTKNDYFLSKTSPTTAELTKSQQLAQNQSHILLKIAICRYYLADYHESVGILRKLAAEKTNENSSQIYYYLAVSQIKLHELETFAKQQQRQEAKSADACLNFSKLKSKNSQPHSSLDDPATNNYLQQAILNLQSSIDSNTNKKIMAKSCKTLLKLYIEHKQFYQTEYVIKLAQKYQLNIDSYKELSQACMMVIKQKYAQALPVLEKLLDCVNLDMELGQTIAENGQQRISSRHNLKKIHNSNQQQLNLHYSVRSPNPEHSRRKQSQRQTRSPRSSPPSEPCPASCTHPSQLQWMKPTILLFRAYAEYFLDNFIECLSMYQAYDSYMKDYLGAEPDTCVFLSYNKALCQGLLMLDNEMVDQSLDKFMLCIDAYHRLLNAIPVQPILLRIIGLMKIGLSDRPYVTEGVDSRPKIFTSMLEILDHYMPVIKSHPLVHYYYGLVLYQLQRYKQASEAVERCLKVADECTWKYLYVKGVIEIKNANYRDAVRQFSAGLLIEEKPDLYLGRCVCYLQLFEDSEGQKKGYMEKSFEDLQKFIELEENKNKISKWVTKILFFNKAYEEVRKSIKKISMEDLEADEEISQIEKCLNIYNGIFEDGGVLGQIIINSFEGKFYPGSVEINGQRHEINTIDYVEEGYIKWLNILNLYASQRYQQLIKFLQLTIFEQKNQQQTLQLRYNLGIVYYLIGESSKADNVLANLPKYMENISERVDKFINRNFVQDECIDDLQVQFKSSKRISSFLPFRRVVLDKKYTLMPGQAQKCIYVRISIPFPNFFKPNIDICLDDLFIVGQTSPLCIPKKIEAPWIRKVTGQVQFTDNVIDSQDISILEQEDILVEASEHADAIDDQ